MNKQKVQWVGTVMLFLFIFISGYVMNWIFRDTFVTYTDIKVTVFSIGLGILYTIKFRGTKYWIVQGEEDAES